MQHTRPPPPRYPGKLTTALLGKKSDFQNFIGNLILIDNDFFHSKSQILEMGENDSHRVINTPDLFDTDCLTVDQRIMDFMAFSLPSVDLFMLVIDSENCSEEKVVGQINRLQEIFGAHVTQHLVVMLPNRESSQALGHLQEMFNVPVVSPGNNLPAQCKEWCEERTPYVHEHKDYSKDVLLRRKAALEKMRPSTEQSDGRDVPDKGLISAAGTGQSTLSSAPQTQQDQHFNIILLGQTGTGKSSTGNTILAFGKENITPFKSAANSIPVTNCCDFRFMNKTFGSPVRLVDTPDFFHEQLENPDHHVNECRKYCQPGRCVVLLVMQLGRFTDGEKGILEKLEKMMGWSIRNETILLLTHREELRGNLQLYIQANCNLNQIVQMCSFRFHAFDNNSKDKNQVFQLIKKIPYYRNLFPKIAKQEEALNCSLV